MNGGDEKPEFLADEAFLADQVTGYGIAATADPATAYGVLVAQAPAAAGGPAIPPTVEEQAERYEKELRAAFEKTFKVPGGRKGGMISFEQFTEPVPLRILSEEEFKRQQEEDVRKINAIRARLAKRFDPEGVIKALQDYYNKLTITTADGKVDKVPFPKRLLDMSEETFLTREEEAVLFELVKQRSLAGVRNPNAAFEVLGFYSRFDRIVNLRVSRVDTGVMAHEMCHAFESAAWRDLKDMLIVRDAKQAHAFAEGLTTLLGEEVVETWKAGQKGGFQRPSTGYTDHERALARKFLKDVGRQAALEAYFLGELEVNLDAKKPEKPEDTMRFGKARKAWLWPWRQESPK